MPVITPRLTGHNARGGSGIIGARWRKNEGLKPGIRASKQRVVRFPSAAELNHLATMFEVAEEHGLTRWDHGAIKGPQGSVGHTTAGVLIDRRGAHAPWIGPSTRAAFCAVRKRMIEFAQAVGSVVLLPRGRRTRLTGHDPVVVSDYTALLQYCSTPGRST